MGNVFDDPKIQAIYEAGCAHIEKIRSSNRWEDGALQLPFRCYGGHEDLRYDLAMMTGDGLPMCQGCFGGIVESLDEKNPVTFSGNRV